MGTVFIILLAIGLARAKVQIFADFNFEGLIYDESKWNGNGCHDVKRYAQGVAGSMISDSCLMIYDQDGCKGNSFKLARDMDELGRELGRKVHSYEMCNDEMGGTRIHVDLFDSVDLIGRYNDICGCQDLPSQVSARLEKIKNFGNCIAVYSSDNCGAGEKFEVEAGVNQVSENLPGLNFFIRSISACGTRKECIRLNGEIIKFELKLDEEKISTFAGPKEVTLATKTSFYNNGSATVSQEYEARKTVINSVAVEKSQTISKFTTKDVSSSLSVGIDLGLRDTASGLSVSGSVRFALQQAYGNKETEEETNGTIETHTEAREFVAKQVILVPPCVEYEVSAVLETVEDFPLIYEVFTKVTGEAGGRRLTAEELAVKMDDMIFVEEMDEYTAIYKAVHTIKASAGVDAKIFGEGKEIEGCAERLQRD